jgi:phosphatidylglycerophosphatase A
MNTHREEYGMIDKIVRFLASAGGLGYAPIAPGTFGTLLGSLFFFLMRAQPQPVIIKFSAVVAVVAIIVAHLAEKTWHQKDCQKIVIDEVAGVMVAYCFVPYTVYHLVLGFFLFRLFDIAKIFPARWAQDNLKGGLGVVTDDLVAGAQAGILMLYLPKVVVWVGQALTWLRGAL